MYILMTIGAAIVLSVAVLEAKGITDWINTPAVLGTAIFGFSLVLAGVLV